jgi:phage shock protein C
MTNRLYRSRKDRLIGGVCGGLGAYFGIDPVIVRAVFVIVAIWGGIGFLAYLVLWIIIPAEERLGAASQDVISANVSEIEQQAQDLASEARGVFAGGTRAPTERTMWAAVALIVLGAALLVGNLTGIAFEKLWPILLVALGAYLIYQAAQRRE